MNREEQEREELYKAMGELCCTVNTEQAIKATMMVLSALLIGSADGEDCITNTEEVCRVIKKSVKEISCQEK